MIRTFFLFVAFLIATPALAQDYPALSGRVVDTADLLDPGQEAQLTAKLEALERASSASSSSPPARPRRAERSRIMASGSAAPGGSASESRATASC